MYPVVRVQKRIPDGSVWQRYRGYRLPDVQGVARVYLPGGTHWWNPVGGWVTPSGSGGINLFHPGRPFVISCHGPDDAKRFYIDLVRASTIAGDLIEYLDLYLDVMIDAAGSVSEKDEEHLHRLDAAEQVAVRRARDDVRARIAALDPLFDPTSEYFALPADARELEGLPD
ncbi:MAG: DUF402 domain-containing protein [Chloroflexota bacterium]|nr:DUF402 domain-containing protein [Chloroflexota bacterium]